MQNANDLLLLLKSSWQGSVLILLVLTLQWICGRRLAPRWRYALWLLVIARLALPWSVPSTVSLFNWINLPKNTVPIIQPAQQASISNPQAAGALSREIFKPDAGIARTHRFGKLAPWLNSPASGLLLAWITGALLLALYLTLAHYRLFRKVGSCRPLIDAPTLNLFEDCKQVMRVLTPITLVETAHVGSPALFGFIRPRLLLPVGLTRNFSSAELRYVFLHELSHVKRNDILAAWLMTALQIVHWFNPFVWLAFHRMRVDREIACDALALSYANQQENRSYGRTIIKLLEEFGRSTWAPSVAGTLENKNQLKERLSMIATFKQTNRWPALAITLFAGLALITLTDAQSGQPSQAPAQAEEGGPPRIISTSPRVGATDVDPSLNELTVTFDQDMGGGFSWTGGGPDYPPSDEGRKVEWRDKRTCVLRVKLEPGHYYRVGINSKSYRNFKNVAGVSALPSALFFTTQGARDADKLKTQVPQVISFVPMNGALDVNPALTELRVTFNLPMGGGFSWCGDGPEYPSGPEGKGPYWTEDRQTCVLPVQLKPGSTYRLWLNSPSHNNFQSAAGVPLESIEYSFKTSEQ